MSRQAIELFSSSNSTSNGPSISEEEFKQFRQFLEVNSGIILGDNKQYLVNSRLSRVIDEFHLSGFGELMKKLSSDAVIRKRIMNAMTTNETSWFRDTYPYEILKEKLLPELVKARRPRIRMWSAACSSGQEPYSLSMIVSEYLMSQPGAIPSDAIEIIGTDISSEILEQAKAASYDDGSVARGLSDERKRRFFQQVDGKWRVNADIQRRISFREMNLMQSYTLLGKFDIIFCRNVLIYFSTELKKDILMRMSKALNRGGYLILGGSESVSGYTDCFELVRWKNGVVYRLKD